MLRFFLYMYICIHIERLDTCANFATIQSTYSCITTRKERERETEHVSSRGGLSDANESASNVQARVPQSNQLCSPYAECRRTSATGRQIKTIQYRRLLARIELVRRNCVPQTSRQLICHANNCEGAFVFRRLWSIREYLCLIMPIRLMFPFVEQISLPGHNMVTIHVYVTWFEFNSSGIKINVFNDACNIIYSTIYHFSRLYTSCHLRWASFNLGVA